MYSNLSKSQTLPIMAVRVSFESQFSHQLSTFTSGFCLKSYLNPSFTPFGSVKPLKCGKNMAGFTILGKKRTHLSVRTFSSSLLGDVGLTSDPSKVMGFTILGKETTHLRARTFSTSLSGNNGVSSKGGSLPWLNESDPSRVVGPTKGKVSSSKGGRSSWEVSAEKFIEKKRGLNEENDTSRDRGMGEGNPRLDRDRDRVRVRDRTFDSRDRRRPLSNADVDEEGGRMGRDSPNWDRTFGSRDRRRPSNADVEEGGRMGEDRSTNWIRTVDVGWVEDEREEDDDDDEVVDDPRWDRIRTRFRGGGNTREGSRRWAPQKWGKEDNLGRRTWREANESSVPKMVGEGVYGVGPVLAALSAGRREFYVLYVQEGLDLSKNNKRKKDKKGFERVLKIANNIGLTIKEVSKHDLNMVVENRPHQGLVLDASPLEMVNIRELDPVFDQDNTGQLWVALDEVMDPQNLGAIIRSSYFFGACGVVLCAKNSAPLSGVVSKASAGSLELMEIRSCKNMMQFLTSSSENGWLVIGGSVSPKSTPLCEIPTGKPTVLVLGSEGTGLRPLVERSCTHLVRITGNIPVDTSVRLVDDEGSEDVRSFMAVESLNVSVAAGVLLHHFIGMKSSGDNGVKLVGEGNEDVE